MKLSGIFRSKPKEHVQQNITNDHLKMNLKGEQMKYTKEFTKETITNQLSRNNAPMFSNQTRLRIWGTLGLFGIYSYLIYKLMKYRLKSDDLDLMEREVKEEWNIKKRVKDLNSRST